MSHDLSPARKFTSANMKFHLREALPVRSSAPPSAHGCWSCLAAKSLSLTTHFANLQRAIFRNLHPPELIESFPERRRFKPLRDGENRNVRNLVAAAPVRISR